MEQEHTKLTHKLYVQPFLNHSNLKYNVLRTVNPTGSWVLNFLSLLLMCVVHTYTVCTPENMLLFFLLKETVKILKHIWVSGTQSQPIYRQRKLCQTTRFRALAAQITNQWKGDHFCCFRLIDLVFFFRLFDAFGLFGNLGVIGIKPTTRGESKIIFFFARVLL